MTPLRVVFTDLELDPTVLHERCIQGAIPIGWQRCRFTLQSEVTYPVNKANRWLRNNIEGRWAIYCDFTASQRQITVAFEQEVDAMTFVMADGATQAFKEL